jgi:NAD(P)-dependent dehydrogenase (short-subunit alcohol dehydrogenase family)
LFLPRYLPYVCLLAGSEIGVVRAAESARIVNVSSGLGSLAINGDPSTPFYQAKVVAYNASKAALNMFTVDLAYDLRDTKITLSKVMTPAMLGFVRTDECRCLSLVRVSHHINCYDLPIFNCQGRCLEFANGL